MVRLTALGGLALLGEEGPVAGAAGRGRNLALMVLLDRAGEAGTSRDKLAAFLWPESDRSRSRHSLDQALYTLRRALGREVIVSVAGGLALDRERCDSDVSAFLRALDEGSPRRAVEVYGGPFLDGFHLSRAPEFERWVDGERGALERRYAGALEQVARDAGKTGEDRLAVDHWRRLATVSPLSSRVTLELMRALERAGDRTKALEAARVHAALVGEELGAEPDPSVVAYVEELERGPGGGAGGDDTAAAVGGVGPRSGPAPGGVAAAGAGEAPSGPRRSGGSRTSGAWVAVAVAIVLSLAAGVVATRRAPAREAPPRVGVAAFENRTGDPSLDPLGRMAADWVGEGLVRTGLVAVVGPDGSMADVASVVEGRLYRTGDSLWLQASIRRPSSGVLLRALDPVATDAADPAGALEPLRQRVLGAMGILYDPRIDAWAEGTLRPPSYPAYVEFAAGIERYGARDLPGMAEHFEGAVRLDPDYLTARLWLAWTASLAGDWARADSIARGLRADRDRMSPVERAWHDRQLALYAGDNQRSYEAAVRMAELAPRSGWIVALADAALAVNRPREAIVALEEAGMEALGPVRDHGASLLAFAYHVVGEYERELELTDETVEAIGLDWDFNGPGVRALAALGRVDALESRLDELRNVPASPYGGPRGPASLLAAAAELRVHGHPEQADAVVDRALEIDRSLERGSPSGASASTAERSAAGWSRVRLLYEVGRWEEASRELEGLSPDPGDHRWAALRALVAARLGDE
ncbi:MAG: BTAD domain-containing putative transcriptional regulator, partial [Gemmatimonadota bacterium]